MPLTGRSPPRPRARPARILALAALALLALAGRARAQGASANGCTCFSACRALNGLQVCTVTLTCAARQADPNGGFYDVCLTDGSSSAAAPASTAASAATSASVVSASPAATASAANGTAAATGTRSASSSSAAATAAATTSARAPTSSSAAPAGTSSAPPAATTSSAPVVSTALVAGLQPGVFAGVIGGAALAVVALGGVGAWLAWRHRPRDTLGRGPGTPPRGFLANKPPPTNLPRPSSHAPSLPSLGRSPDSTLPPTPDSAYGTPSPGSVYVPGYPAAPAGSYGAQHSPSLAMARGSVVDQPDAARMAALSSSIVYAGGPADVRGVPLPALPPGSIVVPPGSGSGWSPTMQPGLAALPMAAPRNGRAAAPHVSAQGYALPPAALRGHSDSESAHGSDHEGHSAGSGSPILGAGAQPSAESLQMRARNIYRVIAAYEPQFQGDLRLVPGRRVQVVELAGDGWATGVDVLTGERGVFPEEYVGIRRR